MSLTRSSSCVGLFAFALTSVSSAAVLFEETQVAVKAGASVIVPAAHSFDISATGSYRIVLTDIGAAPGPPLGVSAALNPALLVTRGVDLIARLDAAGTRDVQLTPGTYVLRMSGRAQANRAAQLNAAVSQGSNTLTTHAVGLVPDAASNAAESLLQARFRIDTAGTHTVELTDRQFPVALADLQLIVTRAGTGVMCVPAHPACPGVTGNSFLAEVGEYDLGIVATADAVRQEGLYSVRIAGTSSNAYANTLPVGKLPAAEELQLPSVATYSLTATNLPFPAPLSEVHLALVQGADAAVLNAPGTTQLAAGPGTAKLFVLAIPNVGGVGTLGLDIAASGQTVLSEVRAINTQSSTTKAFNQRVLIPAAGTYQLQLRDFVFPQAFSSLAISVTQGATILASSTTAAVPLVFSVPSAGAIDVGIAATPAASGNGLFGISVTAQGSSSPLAEMTQGVGGLFKSRTVMLTGAGRFDLSLNDLQFPASFVDLALIVTRGSTSHGQIFAAGGTTPTPLRLDVSAGDYVINLIASAGNQNYGVFGLKLEDVPPTPPTPPVTNSPSVVEERGGGGGAFGNVLMLLLLALASIFYARRNSLTRRAQHCPTC